MSEEVAPHGITYRQSHGARLACVEGELSQAELATKMMVEPPTLVGILDRMERDGWITRNGCPSDRRKKLIRATAAAEPVWEKIAEGGRRVRARATEGLPTRNSRRSSNCWAGSTENLEAHVAIGNPLESLT